MKVSPITKILAEKCPLGIDIDSFNQFKLLKTYFNAKWLAEKLNGKVELYQTKHGYHIKIIGVKTNLFHRLGLGDDPERIYLSELRGGYEFADDVLFDVKELRKGNKVIYASKPEKLDDDWILRLPFWFMPRRKPKSIWRCVK